MNNIIIISLIFALIAFLLYLNTISELILNIKRLIKLHHYTKKRIADSKDGEGYFTGKADKLNHSTLLTPFSKIPCAWYAVKIEKRVTKENRNKNTRSTINQIVYSHTSPGFILQDESASAVIITNESTKILTKINRWRKSNLDEYKLEIDLPTLYLSRYTLTEQYILPNENVEIYGEINTIEMNENINNQLQNSIKQTNDFKTDCETSPFVNKIVTIPYLGTYFKNAIKEQEKNTEEKTDFLNAIKNKFQNRFKAITLSNGGESLGILSTQSSRSIYLYELMALLKNVFFFVLITLFSLFIGYLLFTH